MTATVVAVDAAGGRLQLRDAGDAAAFTLAVPPGTALAGIAPGDVIMVDYMESVALEMAPPGDPGAEIALAAEAPSPGAEPGGAAVGTRSLVGEFVAYDRAQRLARVRDAEGAIRRIAIPPRLAGFAAALAPGDRVLVTITEATAVSVTRPATGPQG